MKTLFQEDEGGSLNGMSVGDATEVGALLKSFMGRKPFVFRLVSDSGMTLTLGYSHKCGFVQHSSPDGMPPYLMALNEAVAHDDKDFAEFLAGGTPTPIRKKYCLPINVVEAIVAQFVTTGERSSTVAWKEI